MCLHEEFDSFVGVHRITNNAGDVIHYQADIRITCTKCGAAFKFIGLPVGLSFVEPACSFDREEARMPLEAPRQTKKELIKLKRGAKKQNSL